MKPFYILTIMVLFAQCVAAGSEEPIYRQLNRAIIRLEHMEFTVQEGANAPVQKVVPDGTGFFVRSSNDLYVVSARHVVDKPHNLRARVQCQIRTNAHPEVIMLELPRGAWVFHPAEGDKDTQPVDVAAMKIPWIKERSIKHFRYETPDSDAKDKNQLPNKDAEPPQPILVFGFPADVGFQLLEQRPLGRLGIISMTTGKEFLKIKGKFVEERCCLVDARMFPGNSGSPVMNELRITDSKPRLLGLVIAVNNALDFGIMEPVSRIREVLDLAREKKRAGHWKLMNK